MKKVRQKECRVCGEKFTPRYSTAQRVCSSICAYQYAKDLKEKDKKGLDKTRLEYKTRNQKNYLKDEIQKLSRLIDERFGFGCCCCGKSVEGSGHGAHYHNKGGNENIQFNLDNIHRSRAHCNMFSSEHKKGYLLELEKRYGRDYVDYLEDVIRIKYKEMHFTSDEITNALKVTRQIIRDFNTYTIDNPLLMRKIFNEMIGLYK